MAAVTSSLSTAVTSRSSAAMASASAPMPQPRSAMRVRPARLEPPGVQRGDLQPGRLLQPRLGEQHPVGERAELGRCPRPQLRLAEHRGDEAGGVPGLAQLAHRAQRHPSSTRTAAASRAAAARRRRAVRPARLVSIPPFSCPPRILRSSPPVLVSQMKAYGAPGTGQPRISGGRMLECLHLGHGGQMAARSRNWHSDCTSANRPVQ